MSVSAYFSMGARPDRRTGAASLPTKGTSTTAELDQLQVPEQAFGGQVGSYEMVLRIEARDVQVRTYQYPFEVRRTGHLP